MERNTSTVTDQTDIQLTHVIDTVVDFNAVVQLRHDSFAGTMLSEERVRLLKSLGTMDDLHVAAAITVANADGVPEELKFPNFDSACSTVLTNSMLNCSAVEEYTATNVQAEFGGVQEHHQAICAALEKKFSKSGEKRISTPAVFITDKNSVEIDDAVRHVPKSLGVS